LITLTQAFEVYEPQVMRWVFASRKPNLDFTIAFDLDVLKAYDDFDRTERIAYGAEEAEELKKSYEARIYDLSLVEPSKKSTELPRQFGFRHLCNVLQIFEGDIAKTERHYEVAVEDKERFRTRAQCAWTWIQSYAPPEFHFRLRKETDAIEKTSQPKAVQELIALLESGKAWNEESLGSEVFSVMKRNGLDAKTFFGECYRILIDKKNGPKLASFLLTIGVERAAAYLKRAL
jgi:lysyl-tRNA synthetase class 1